MKLFQTKSLVDLRVWLIVLACQFTDVGFFGVKAGEAIVILLVPAVLWRLPRKSGDYLFPLVFLLLLALTYCKNPFIEFFPPLSIDSFLKRPYVISAVRTVELFLCFAAMLYVQKDGKSRRESAEILDAFFLQNAVIAVGFIAAYILAKAGIEMGLTYGEGSRLKGFFVEGGPLGLYYGALLCCNYFYKRRFGILQILFLIVVILAQSKAGILLIVAILAWYVAFGNVYKRAKLIGLSVMLIFALGAYMLYKDQLMGYVNDISSVEESLIGREDDPNIVMGRISGIFIGEKMIEKNPVLGVGSGNYSLVRNDPAYRGFFPEVEFWDLTGLGIFTVVVENGFLGFALLFFALRRKYKGLASIQSKYILIAPIFCFVFGVQLYFIYPWILFGLAQICSDMQMKDT